MFSANQQPPPPEKKSTFAGFKGSGLNSKMLCCGGNKDSGRDLKSAQNTPSRQPMNMPYPGGSMAPQRPGAMGTGISKGLSPPPLTQAARMQQQQQMNPGHINNFDLRNDYKKPSGISEEVFRQLETVQNRYDSSTAAAFRAVQKSGEMVVRTLDPRQFIRLASETAPKINIDTNDPNSLTSFVEIVKRPGQTLGLYIREGNGIDRHDGVFISRIAIDSAVYSSGCLQLGDEILAVNLVDVTRMSLDDVVIIMSIPRRLVLTTRRSRSAIGGVQGNRGNSGPGYMVRENGGNSMDGKISPSPIVSYKGGRGIDGYRDDYGSGGGMVESPRREYMPYRDARTLTWDRNPKPDRSDPKYFPVNSLPRQNSQQRMTPTIMMSTGVSEDTGYSSRDLDPLGAGMPPPMRELNTSGYPPMILTPRTEESRYQQGSAAPGFYPSPTAANASTAEYYGNDSDGGMSGPGRGQRLLHRMASDPHRYRNRHSGLSPTSTPVDMTNSRRSYTLQYPSSRQYSSMRGSTSSQQGRSRHFSGMDYASDTEALQSPSVSSVRMSRTSGRGFSSGAGLTGVSTRSSSLPRTFQREALLRHPELSMEMDRLADPMVMSGLSTDDQMSDSGAVSAPESVITARKRGYRSPSTFSNLGHDVYSRTDRMALEQAYQAGKEIRRTPSTSAIYETLRRSKELRESLSSRPSSRLSMDNEKLRDMDMQYFSDSEHQLISASYSQKQDIRRIRNRTLSGLDAMRLNEHHGSTRPSSATSLRPITPSFHNEKESSQNFVNFNPADFVKYKSEVMPENGGLRLSGILNLHLLSGRGLRTGGRSRRIRDLYCVVEVDHIHKARTVVRSGGINYDWDERFDLDLVNNLEVEFLVYSWDPQLRHRLCYRSSLRLANLFGKGQNFQQVALRLHPTGTLYLTLTYMNLQETFDRTRYRKPTQQLFGVSLETVLEKESSAFPVPIILKRCIEEIELRGLDIIGIYRLCGAEAKKNTLRLAFEENSLIVDLSSANVPDINVITGLIKEYLRELPQPVFTSCLYQMLVDAMGVFLPDDPDGNAKLVFSILDCLPKANRNCLMYIMDHLSKVSSQSTRNKMSAQNLSICFAPILMMDFSAGTGSTSISNAVTLDSNNISEPIQILTYLIEIWPKAQE